MNKKNIFFIIILIILVLALFVWINYLSFINSKLDIEYYVSPYPKEDKINVKIKVSNSRSNFYLFHEQTYSDLLNTSKLVVLNSSSKRSLHRRYIKLIAKHHGKSFNAYLWNIPEKDFLINYDVHPGTYGRHGHQGYLSDDFAMAAGEIIFLVPYQKINSVKVFFKVPKNWTIYSPWEKQNGFYIPADESDLIEDSLAYSFVAFGNFTSVSKDIKGVNVTVYSYADWNESYKKNISETAFKIYEHQQSVFGRDGAQDYSILFTPEAEDSGDIFGHCWSNGQAFGMPSQTWLGWEHLAHRLHHKFNRYKPFGMYPDNINGTWWSEGTAEFYEVESAELVGWANESLRYKSRYEGYLYSYEEYDAPLSKDYEQNESVVEFLHYTKAPLVTYMINQIIMNETDKSLDDVMLYQYAKYGNHKDGYKVLEDLKEVTGIDFSDFFSKYVDGTEFIEFEL